MKKNEKFVAEIKNRINELIEQRRTDIQSVEASLQSARDEVVKASERMENATFRADTEAYGTAKADKERALLSIEMYSKRLEQLRGSQMLPESECSKVDESIVKKQDELKEETVKKVVPIINELISIRDEYKTEMGALNSLRADWVQRAWQKKKKIGINSYDIDLPKSYDDGYLSYFLFEVRNNRFTLDTLELSREGDRGNALLG